MKGYLLTGDSREDGGRWEDVGSTAGDLGIWTPIWTPPTFELIHVGDALASNEW